MFKFYEYSKEGQKEIDRLVAEANGKPTVLKRDTTIYPNNNKDKPFSTDGIAERLEKPMATSPEIEKQKEMCQNFKKGGYGISDDDYKNVSKISNKELDK